MNAAGSLWLPKLLFAGPRRRGITTGQRIRKSQFKRLRTADAADPCCHLTCERLRQCLVGNSLELTPSGVVNDDCTDCNNINTTFQIDGIAEDVTPPSGFSCAFDSFGQTSTFELCESDGWPLFCVIHFRCDSGANSKIAAGIEGAGGPTWTLESNAIGYADFYAALLSLCRGESVELTPGSGASGFDICDYQSSTCTVQIV